MALRIVYANLWRTGSLLAASSEHPQNPKTDTQIDTPSQYWRSRSGVGSGNGLFVIADPVYGATLVTNGNFDTSTTGWTPYNSTLSVSSVEAAPDPPYLVVSRNEGAEQGATQVISGLTIGKLYRISGSVLSGTSGNENFYFLFGTGSVLAASSATWTLHSLFFRATATSHTLYVVKASATPGTMFFDNIAVQEVVSSGRIDVTIGASSYVATIANGSYNGTTLAAAVKTALDTATSATFTCTYSETTRKFTIARAAGNFTLSWAGGTAADVLGFDWTAVVSPAATYTGDFSRIHHPAEYIDGDLATAQEVNAIALVYHNISAAATIKLYGADDSAFTTNVTIDTLTRNGNSMWVFLAASRTKRYFRLEIADPTNSSGYIQIADIILGKYWEPTTDVLAGCGQARMDIIDPEYSDALVAYGESKPRPYTKSISLAQLPDSDSIQALAMMNAVGKNGASWFCFDSVAPNTSSYLMRLQDIEEIINPHFGYHEWALQLIEVL